MIWESWVVIAVFVINLAFLLIMSFVSPYYKVILSKGVGKIFNIVWMCVIVIAAAVLIFYNVQCNVLQDPVAKEMNCKGLAVSIVVFLALLTILNMSWSIYNTIEYDKKKVAMKINTKQEALK